MPAHYRSSPYRHFFWGLFFVIIGLLLLLDNMDLLDASEFFHYWPVLLIVFGLYKMTAWPRSVLAGSIILIAGVLLLLDRMYIIHVRIWDLWPLVIILVGASMLFGYRHRRRWDYEQPPAAPPAPGGNPVFPGSDTDNYVTMSAVMSGNNRHCISQDFRGGNLSAVMGGCDLDLRGAYIKESPATISVFALMGGIKIMVPMNWTVIVQGTPILGGMDDKTRPAQGTDQKELIITGEVVMGGVEITN